MIFSVQKVLTEVLTHFCTWISGHGKAGQGGFGILTVDLGRTDR